jgi:hypothetical protein
VLTPVASTVLEGEMDWLGIKSVDHRLSGVFLRSRDAVWRRSGATRPLQQRDA